MTISAKCGERGLAALRFSDSAAGAEVEGKHIKVERCKQRTWLLGKCEICDTSMGL